MILKTLVVVLTCTAVFALGNRPTAKAQTPNEPAQQPSMVVIKPGDTLSKIAKANSTTYPRLFDANENVKHPDLIYAGESLRIPHHDEVLKSRPLPANVQAIQPAAPAQPKPKPAVNSYRPTTSAKPSSAVGASGDVWDRLAQCESGGNWSINTGNGYYGGLQFTPSSWRAAGGSGMPHQASREEQIQRGKILQSKQGWGAWPACTRKLGIQ